MAKLRFCNLVTNNKSMAVMTGVLDSGKRLVEIWNRESLEDAMNNHLYNGNLKNAQECQRAIASIESAVVDVEK